MVWIAPLKDKQIKNYSVALDFNSIHNDRSLANTVTVSPHFMVLIHILLLIRFSISTPITQFYHYACLLCAKCFLIFPDDAVDG